MRQQDLNLPSVPVGYVQLSLQLAEERGCSPDQLLEELGIYAGMLEQPDTRLGLFDYGRLCLLIMQRCNEPALGYEFGLRNSVTLHGFYGFGVMSQQSLRDAIEFAVRFAPLRMPGWSLRLRVDAVDAYIVGQENVPFGRLRQYAQDMLLSGLASSYLPLMKLTQRAELHFDCPEPHYYPRFAQRLPPCRFAAGEIAIRFPASELERPLATANPVTARLVARQCEQEMALLGFSEDWLDRVRALLRATDGHYPSQAELARRLYLSERSFRRRLDAHQTSYRALLDTARQRDALRLMSETQLSLDAIAERVGYRAAANFSRAFVRWTGQRPGAYRRG